MFVFSFFLTSTKLHLFLKEALCKAKTLILGEASDEKVIKKSTILIVLKRFHIVSLSLSGYRRTPSAYHGQGVVKLSTSNVLILFISFPSLGSQEQPNHHTLEERLNQTHLWVYCL